MENKQPTFRQQYDKIITAYIEGKLDPENPCACFVGNLLNGEHRWIFGHPSCDLPWRIITKATECVERASGGLYTVAEVLMLEANFMLIWNRHKGTSEKTKENALFRAMDSTLDMLRKLHEKKGEIIEDGFFVHGLRLKNAGGFNIFPSGLF